MCWNPCRYSCSNVGTTTCLRFHTDSSSLLSTGGAGSRHSGMKMMNDRGSLESDSNRSKCVTIDSISSSQKGGLASNDPDTGLNSRIGLSSNQTEKLFSKTTRKTFVFCTCRFGFLPNILFSVLFQFPMKFSTEFKGKFIDIFQSFQP